MIEKGLTRFHWQVLNRTHMDGISIKENLYARHYVSPAQLDEILDSMVKREWIEMKENADQHVTEIRLTAKGEEEFQDIAALV